MLGISSWTWIAAAALVLLALASLIRVTIGLVRRLKDLNHSLRAASGELNEIVEEMRGDLDRTSGGLAALRQRREEQDD